MVALNLPTNITAVIAAAGSLFNIVDFQGNCVDAPGDKTTDFTGVETYTCVQGVWLLNEVGTNFRITAANLSTATLSMPMVGTTTFPSIPFLVYQQAAIRANSIMIWQVEPNLNFPGKFNIISAIPASPVVALTAWAKRPGSTGLTDSPSGPLTLTEFNQNDVQQAFTLTPVS